MVEEINIHINEADDVEAEVPVEACYEIFEEEWDEFWVRSPELLSEL